MILLTSQKNEIFNLIESNEMSPQSFELSEAKAVKGIVTILKHKASDFQFTMNEASGGVIVQFSPAKYKFSEDVGAADWRGIKNFMIDWISYLKREISQVDRWKQLEQQIEQLHLNSEAEQDYFTAQEFEELKERMNLLKSQLRKLELLPNQLSALESKIDHLTELAVSLGKFDWKNLFIGTIVSMVIQLGVTQENAKALWSAIK
ncbi:MAG: hypothetical protein EOO46_20955, partial [Flavobacterium sp.]